ncbi:MAG: hypothetical protein Q8M26_05270 [Pseudolabrys sp.]|nr:hypothetical protein [Pseudolabrys sp.]
MKLKRRSEVWPRKLPRPVIVRGGRKLQLLADCRTYILNLDEGEQGLPKWQRAAELALTASEGGDLEAVSLQFERILVHQNKWCCQPREESPPFVPP